MRSLQSAVGHRTAALSIALALVVGCAGKSPVADSSGPAPLDSAGAVDEPAAVSRYAPGETTPEAEAIVSAPDRTAEDRETDARRHPAEFLTFLRIEPGMQVADLGAGSGHTMELLVRAVGEEGVVFAQNNQRTLDKFVSESWPERLKRPVNNRVIRLDREFEDPLPPEAKDLDMVTLMYTYHDVVAAGEDLSRLNDAVFKALKSGGKYVIADHSAADGAGLSVASEKHRIEESLVRQQVEAAGFVFERDAAFLRDDNDSLDTISYQVGFKTDRFLLLFAKP